MNMFGELQIEGNVSNSLKPEHVYARALVFSDNTQDRKRQYGVIHAHDAFFERVASENVVWNHHDILDKKYIKSVSNHDIYVDESIFSSLFDNMDIDPTTINVIRLINQKYQNYKEQLTYCQSLQILGRH